MRVVLVALAVCASAPAWAAKVPDQECSRSFVLKWRSDKDAAINMLPEQPCLMQTGSGPYVCYKDGCVRVHVYLEDN